MFNNKTDRLNYATLLMPPIGYELTKGVVTTYSLDLETLTAATIALGVREATDSVVAETPVAMLRALQKVSDKIVVFCESGQIKLPKTESPLLLLLEKMIVPIALPKKNASFPSFHPKMWILEYENAGGEKLYRFIILSRNLTFDRSWDVSFMMEGRKGSDEAGHTAPLIAFLGYLSGHIGADKEPLKGIVASMQGELADVKFTLDRDEFEDFLIIPIGIDAAGVDMTSDDLFKGYPCPGRGANFHELTIISPFLSKETIKFLNSDTLSLTGTRRKLFTRRTELPEIKDVAGNFDVYVLKDTIIDGEEALPEGDGRETKLQDIHAKLYLRRKNSCNDLYLGSMNASNSGICRNVEMMIKLKTGNRYINMDRLCEDLFAGAEDNKSNPFEKVDFSNLSGADADSSEQDELIFLLKQICRAERSCKVIKQDDGKFAMHVCFSLDSDVMQRNVLVNPIRVSSPRDIDVEMAFENLDILQLTEFFVITVKGEKESVSRVITIPTEGIPEERDRCLVQGIVKDKKTFVEYVAMALGDDLLKLFGSERKEYCSGETKKHRRDTRMPALYERMLRVAYEDKRKLVEIERIMGMIDDTSIVTDEFREMYNTFKLAVEP